MKFPVEEWLIIQISDTKLASLSSVLASSATILEEFSIVSTCQLCLLEREEKNWQETSHNGRNPVILCENSLLEAAHRGKQPTEPHLKPWFRKMTTVYRRKTNVTRSPFNLSKFIEFLCRAEILREILEGLLVQISANSYQSTRTRSGAQKKVCDYWVHLRPTPEFVLCCALF